jgi:AraC-like DNA-binding protein
MVSLSPHIIPTTPLHQLKTDVEQRTCFSLDRCELNIYETHRKIDDVHLQFGGFTITSMIRGKKVLHEEGIEQPKSYLPGESYILSSKANMVIDFPEASLYNPSQCTALVIDDAYWMKQLEYINELFPREKYTNQVWQWDAQTLWLQNDEEVARLSNVLIRLFSGTDPMKDVLIDIKLKELMLRFLQLQHYNELIEEKSNGNGRFNTVLDYIRKNITGNFASGELSKLACMSKSVFYRAFVQEFGMSPLQLIVSEKMKYAKALLANNNVQIKEVAYSLGFSDPNYFIRVFKKMEGVTPGEYAERLHNNI